MGLDFSLTPVDLAQILIGAELYLEGVGGLIVETEAYDADDPASHSFGGLSGRNATMFGPVGHAYVYRIYGVHLCLNVVCGPAPGGAVLIRALEPTHGLDVMRVRRGAEPATALCSGPGKLCQALAVSMAHDALAIDAPPFAIASAEWRREVLVGPRIGISKAADRPWRFGLAGSKYLSRTFP
ncbi:MAG TPA: DNA-3-methyladenine glycosylase [Caulobacteraceae bacterium]|nr:DNA-3-methyladenine glycosylase [Caulobacteraceae bacterium]